MSTQLSASSFSTGVASERSAAIHPAATFRPNERMIDASSSSLEPINRCTEPMPRPAADAMSRMVVAS